ncbi:fasciclin domain-containing protein [Halomicronema sp. CCY15110]|uniref:fasciclin domain-containing protein n=1 Tax=Halomicronema sp. CCY15110 TaxID=2767773 RepID=UPI001EF3A75D|nr:fasciclin domain-containing protein [Halomicronema sp. CCY15110]
MFPKRLVVGLIGLGAIATLGACQAPSDTAVEPADEGMATEEPTTTEESAGMESAGTIVDVAAGNESFSTLVQAVQAAGLVETLSAEGPYTVFAPTNEAFAALPEGTLDQLLLPENQETLTQILAYHVLPQAVPAAEVMSGDVDTVAGSPISINVDDATGTVMVNEATVVQADVSASNGVIHVIDQVLLPPDLQL